MSLRLARVRPPRRIPVGADARRRPPVTALLDESREHLAALLRAGDECPPSELFIERLLGNGAVNAGFEKEVGHRGVGHRVLLQPQSPRGRQPGRRALSILAIAALSIASCCPGASVVRVPVVVRPAPCLDALPPRPPTTEDDAAWSRYRAAMEGWAALVVRECGGHLLGVADDATGSYGETVR